MTLTVLVSVSLLALVVTAHPILPESELGQNSPVEVQRALQAIFESRTRHLAEQLFTDDKNVHVKFTSPKEQSAYLAQYSSKAIVPLTEGVVQIDDERKLYEALGSLNDVDGGVPVKLEDEAVSLVSSIDRHGELASLGDESSSEVPSPNTSLTHSNISITTSSHLGVILFSCMAALVCLLCVSLALYIATILRPRALASQNACEMLPRVEKQTNANNGRYDGSSREESRVTVDSKMQHLVEVHESLLFDGDVPKSDSQNTSTGAGQVKTIDMPDLITFDDAPAVESNFSDDEGSDEFYDTHADPSTPVLDLVPDIILLHPVEDQSDPPLPSITVTPQSFPTPLPHSPIRCPLQMRELNSSPISRPAWSLRAEEDTSLFVPSPSASSPLISPSSLAQPLPLSPSDDTLSMAIPVPRRRAYRSPIPEFDIALAMQLRPGLGIGADPAWMVRFLMAMFGWFTVLLSGKKDRQQRLVA